jgi:hypothetical protein
MSSEKVVELNPKIPLPIYPGSADARDDGLMSFRRSFFTFNIARADNGLIFEEYDVSTDTTRRKIATTPEQMQKIFDDWFAERSGQMLAFARKIMEPADAS